MSLLRIQELEAELARRDERIAELERDAARLDALEAIEPVNIRVWYYTGGKKSVELHQDNDGFYLAKGETLRQAIDNMQEQQP